MSDDPRIPAGLGPQRQRILEVALAELDVCEDPPCSNRGPRIDQYKPAWARTEPHPWCAWFVTWVLKKALGKVPTGRRRGGVAALRRDARRAGLWLPKHLHSPMPGDAFVMDTGGGKGHIGFVLRVSPEGDRISTVEGNSGDCVRIGTRDLTGERIVGWIDTVPDESCAGYERGLIDGEDVAAKGTR